ncbi:MAG TPA: malonate decarboxylase subunit epsilon [Noviherbaspirillum sp.]|nr:malonate decarboxylase subunit epsilon [Noviherbaspirillum sp.]
MRFALIFGSQGAQRIEHWQQLVTAPDGMVIQALRKQAPEFADSIHSDLELLFRNHVAQPVIYSYQALLWEQLRTQLPPPVCTAGHSLGELAACAAAGLFKVEDGVILAATRARLMDAHVYEECGMLAVIGLDETLVSELAFAEGLDVAVRNGPRHMVVTGPVADIATAARRFGNAGARRLIHLAVHVPSHTSRMAEAARLFKANLERLSTGQLSFPVFSAIDGIPARSSTTAIDALARQIATPLDWDNCLRAVIEMKPDMVLEIGPGDTSVRLLSHIAPEIPARSSDDFRTARGMINWILGHRT